MTVAVIMPLSPASAERFRVASWVLQRLRLSHPDWPVIVGDTARRPWSKSHAVNSAVGRTDADVLVIHDADVIVCAEALAGAVEQVRNGWPWALPHGTVYRLPEGATAEVLAQPPTAVDLTSPPAVHGHTYTRPPYEGVPGGGLFVVSRTAWDTVSGFDERFIGWGSEDVSLGWALDTLAGTHWRGTDPLWHLWHPIEPRTIEMYDNQRLEERYRHANGNVEAMRALVDGTEPARPAQATPYR
jgi:hypothetical protein